jgi:hypothetical protein
LAAGSPPARLHPNLILGAILLIGLLHGLIYVFLTPPWQHYDEPGHFEYAWLAANREAWPAPGEYDQSLRRELAASMQAHDFFKGLTLRPNLVAASAPVWIGVSQVGDRPAYYWLVARVLRPLRFLPVETQLYAARLVSLSLYLASLGAAWGLLGALLPASARLRWIVPLSMALLPGFTELMTAVNNDALAVAAFSGFLCAAARTLRDGLSPWRAAGVALTAGLCMVVKNTVFLALPLGVAVLLLGLIPPARRSWAVGGLLASGLLLAGVLFRPGQARSWYPVQPQAQASRGASAAPGLGSASLQLRLQPGQSRAGVRQPLHPDLVQMAAGTSLTLGSFIWSDQPAQAQIGIETSQGERLLKTFSIDQAPRFFAFTFEMPRQARLAWIQLTLVSIDIERGSQAHFDGVTLAPGAFPADPAPTWQSGMAEQGAWNGQAVRNLVRNASAEKSWLGVRTLPGPGGGFFDQGPLASAVAALGDPGGSAWYFREAYTQLVRTFWAKFGWAHIPLPGWAYTGLALLTWLGILGAGRAAWQTRRSLAWDQVFLLGGAALGVGVQAVVRGSESLFLEMVIPSARYTYPAIIPVMLALCAGWLAWLDGLGSRLRLPGWLAYLLGGLFFLGLIALSLAVQIQYYASP